MLETPQPYMTMFPGKKENVEADDGLPKCFLDIASEAEPGCRIVVELFADKLPKTCANFVKLVKGGHTDAMGRKMEYKNSLLYEMKPGWMVAGGDFINNNGTGGESTFEDREFEDETFSVDYNQAGLLCMLSHGPHTNSSIFFVTLKPADWLKGLYVAFGKVIYGLDALQKLTEKYGSNSGEPKQSVRIVECGQL